MARGGLRRFAPGAAVLLVALLTGLSVGIGLLVARHFQSDAIAISRLYSGVFAGLNDPRQGAAEDALLRLMEEVRRQGIPLVVTDGVGNVTASANLPFEATADQARVKEFVRELDRTNPPIHDSALGVVRTIHFGPVPAKRQLTILAVLQALTIVVMVGVGWLAYRNAMAAQRDRLWVAMAREAAHQMGTPLMSLQGWIERVRSRPSNPPSGLADYLSADAERLDRVARRFERIGNPARLEAIGLGALADRVAGYYRPRLPRHADPIELVVEAAGPGPDVRGDPVLLEWALEALVKNAIDALQGRGGTITLAVGVEEPWATIRVLDTGPGIAKDVRRSLFQPGVTTKSGGWGIGLALATRVVEDAHGGLLTLETGESGACFRMQLPLPAGKGA